MEGFWARAAGGGGGGATRVGWCDGDTSVDCFLVETRLSEGVTELGMRLRVDGRWGIWGLVWSLVDPLCGLVRLVVSRLVSLLLMLFNLELIEEHIVKHD